MVSKGLNRSCVNIGDLFEKYPKTQATGLLRSDQADLQTILCTRRWQTSEFPRGGVRKWSQSIAQRKKQEQGYLSGYSQSAREMGHRAREEEQSSATRTRRTVVEESHRRY